MTGIESNAKMIGVGVVILHLLQGVYGEKISVQLPERSILVFVPACLAKTYTLGRAFFRKKNILLEIILLGNFDPEES